MKCSKYFSQLFSWGDGEYGKLGHGNSVTQKYPKIIQGPLFGKVGIQKTFHFIHVHIVVESHAISHHSHRLWCLWQVVVCVSAGYRHSAAVTNDGELYTWGEGDFGRLGTRTSFLNLLELVSLNHFSEACQRRQQPPLLSCVPPPSRSQ